MIVSLGRLDWSVLFATVSFAKLVLRFGWIRFLRFRIGWFAFEIAWIGL